MDGNDQQPPHTPETGSDAPGAPKDIATPSAADNQATANDDQHFFHPDQATDPKSVPLQYAPNTEATGNLSDQLPPADAPLESSPEAITWTGPEFIEHPKTAMWYGILAGSTLAAVLLGYLLTREILTAVVLVVCAIMFGFVAARRPQAVKFVVDSHGITVGQRKYRYDHFRSFSVVNDDNISSIDFVPLKRFSLPLSIYPDHSRESDLVAVLSQRLPMSDHKRTWTDTLMHRIHF